MTGRAEYEKEVCQDCRAGFPINWPALILLLVFVTIYMAAMQLL